MLGLQVRRAVREVPGEGDLVITKTALAEKFKVATAAFAKDRAGKEPKDAPYHKDAMVDLVYPLLAAAWREGYDEAEAGIPADFNPYK